MVFTQGRDFVIGPSSGLPHCPLRWRVLVCHAADTASLATLVLFGKLFVLRRFLTSVRSGVVNPFRYVP